MALALNSSISNSDGMMKHRTYIALAAAGIIILLIAMLRPSVKYSDAANQLQADRFWIMKAQNKSKYDVVILGDSRTYRGVSPTEMAAHLPNMRIFNFAFSSGSLNPEIFNAGYQLLDEGSKNKVIVLGVTASSLLPLYEKNEQYRQEHNRPRSSYFERVFVNSLLQNFLPFDHDALLQSVTGKKRNHPLYISEYKNDGWVASNKIPEDTTEQLWQYRDELKRYKVKPELVSALLKQTTEWKAQRITVIGFRPPTTQGMQQLEDELSNLDYTQFAKDFEAAGGKWVSVDRAQYHSYDGSHLNEESAIRLSKTLGLQIQNYMHQKTTQP